MQILKSISTHSIIIWNVISCIVFFVFFVGVLLYSWKQRQSLMDEMSQKPLDNQDQFSPKFSQS